MKTSMLSLAIATVAFGASSIYLAVQLGEERAHSEQLASATRALNARITELEKTRAESPLAVSGTFGAFSAINTAPGNTVSAQIPPPGRNEARSEVLGATVVSESVMPQGEAFQRMMRAQMRAHNKLIYADVGTHLGLSREEAARLIDLLTDQQVGRIGPADETTDPGERMRLMQEARRESDAKIAELLGPEKLRSLEDYQRTIPSRQELDAIARQLDGSDASMSDDQRKRLLAALIEERDRVPFPQFAPGSSREDHEKAFTDWHEDYNARVTSQARSILTSEQYSAYDDYQQWQKEMRQQMNSVRVQNGGARGNFVYSTAAPAQATVVGETAVMMLNDPDETPDKKP